MKGSIIEGATLDEKMMSQSSHSPLPNSNNTSQSWCFRLLEIGHPFRRNAIHLQIR